MQEILLLSYIFLSLSSLFMLRAREFTRLYPLSLLSAILFVLSPNGPYFDLVASMGVYIVVHEALKNGFLTHAGFKPPLFDRKVISFGSLLLILGALMGINLAVVLSRIVLANTFSIMALSRAETPIRVGDYQILNLTSLLFLSDGLVYVLKPFLGQIASIVEVHILYTSSLLFLLTMIRRS